MHLCAEYPQIPCKVKQNSVFRLYKKMWLICFAIKDIITVECDLKTDIKIQYDVRFDAIVPTAVHDAASQDVIRLIINVEAQTAFNPGYPLTKRAIYYCSRMISAQHGPIFKKSEYGKIR